MSLQEETKNTRTRVSRCSVSVLDVVFPSKDHFVLDKKTKKQLFGIQWLSGNGNQTGSSCYTHLLVDQRKDHNNATITVIPI